MRSMLETKWGWPVVRLLMAAMFIESFIDKLWHWHSYLSQVQEKGVPFPFAALACAAAVEILGSVSLVLGLFVAEGALLLAAYVFALGFVYFNFWSLSGAAAIATRKDFLKDLAVIAGLLLMALTDLSHREPNERKTS